MIRRRHWFPILGFIVAFLLVAAPLAGCSCIKPTPLATQSCTLFDVQPNGTMLVACY